VYYFPVDILLILVYLLCTIKSHIVLHADGQFEINMITFFIRRRDEWVARIVLGEIGHKDGCPSILNRDLGRGTTSPQRKI